mgnify:CR=1 FL=1
MMFALYIISESIQRISNVRCRILTTSGFTAQFINTSVINNDGIETRVSVFPIWMKQLNFYRSKIPEIVTGALISVS